MKCFVPLLLRDRVKGSPSSNGSKDKINLLLAKQLHSWLPVADDSAPSSCTGGSWYVTTFNQQEDAQPLDRWFHRDGHKLVYADGGVHHVRHPVNFVSRGYGRMRSILGARAVSRDITRFATDVDGWQEIDVELPEVLSVIMSFRVATDERLEMLHTVLERLQQSIGAERLELFIADASPEPYFDRIAGTLGDLPFHVQHSPSDASLAQGFLEALGRSATEYVYLQFDDQHTSNLSAPLLGAACKLLDRYKGLVDVLAVPWPLSVSVLADQGQIELETHKRHGGHRRRAFSFGFYPRKRAVVLEEIDGYTFGIFNNFTYGFFFNNIVTRAADYEGRMRWYLDNVSEKAHDIELSARNRAVGPCWTHIAVCLDDVALLDLDFQHTDLSVRSESPTARAVFDVVRQGGAINSFHETAQRSS